MPVSRHSAEQKAAAVERYHLEGPDPVAKDYGVVPGTICKWAKKLGVETVATGVMSAANEARSASLRERRQQLAELLMDDAFELRKRLRSPALVYAFVGGKSNEFMAEEIPVPPAADVRAISSAIGTLFTRIDKVIETEPSKTTEEGIAMIENIKGDIGMKPFDPDDYEDVIEDDDSLGDPSTGTDAFDQSETIGIP
jgi:transposase-like protein